MPLNHWIQGEEVDAADFQNENAEFLGLIGQVAQIFFGTYSFQGDMFPLLASVSGSTLTVGGPAQQCYVAGYNCSNITQAQFPIATNSGGTTRRDYLYGRGYEADVNPTNRNVRQPDRSITVESVYQTAHDIEWVYIQGNADGTPGTPPSSIYDAVLYLDVAPNASSGAPVIVLPTLASIINGILPSLVNSINGETGALTFEGESGIGLAYIDGTFVFTNTGVTDITSDNGTVTITRTGTSYNLEASTGSGSVAGVTSLNGGTGAMVIEPGSDISVTKTGNNIVVAYDGPQPGAYPVGAVIKRVKRITGTGSLSVELPTLPTGAWMVLGRACATVTNYNFKLNLTGCSGGSESNIGNGNAAANSPEIAMISGNANAGDAPTLTITWTNAGGGSFGNGQLLEIEAIRTS